LLSEIFWQHLLRMIAKSYSKKSQDTEIVVGSRANDFAEYTDVDDSKIWSDFKNGNGDVLIYLYHKYVAQLLRFGIQFAPRDVVKDSIQDLFLYLKERKDQTVEVKNISAYLYKSLYRIINKKVDLAKNLSSLDMINEVKGWRIVVSDEVKLIEQEQRNEQSNKLQDGLDNLSAKQRQALLLYYYEGFTHQEITDIMDLKNKSSVRKLIYRAIDMLKGNFSI
jgi:RNA polymerase sigma factor (sigma-70 family)